MSTSPQPTPGAFDIGVILGQSFNLYFSRFGQYIVIPAVVLFPAYVLTGIINALLVRTLVGAMFYGGIGAVLGGSFAGALIVGLIQWGASALTLALIAKASEGHLAGKSVGLGQAFAGVSVANVIVAAVLFGLATTVGLYLLVLPGLAAAFFLCLAPVAVALDKESGVGSLGRSVKAVLKAPGEVILVVVIYVAYVFLAGAIASAFVFVPFLSQLVSGLFAVLALPWLGIALTLCYNRAKSLGA